MVPYVVVVLRKRNIVHVRPRQGHKAAPGTVKHGHYLHSEANLFINQFDFLASAMPLNWPAKEINGLRHKAQSSSFVGI